jgi:LmbE family N-acetylglucosaminyl deacetylase
MRILHVHAHYDDYEFVAAGTFELWKRQLGDQLTAKVLVCTDGSAGHQFRTREETARLRYQEQEASARIGRYQFELLRDPAGRPFREACLLATTDLLAALWKAIRDFEPDYLFCPPLPADPLAGVHVDHVTIAEAVRKVAYMINVPHAFVAEYPADERTSTPCKVPVILTVYDGYMAGANACDLVIDVEEAFPQIAEMTFCHQSQISEWLPWVARHDIHAPKNLAEWSQALRRRLVNRNRELGLKTERVTEVFTVTAWGQIPTLEQLLRDPPSLLREASNLAALEARLARWRGQAG